MLKQRVSRDLRNDQTKHRYFWQPRFHDFNIYGSDKLQEKLHYIHANPVERGLVENPRNWPWSSFLSYEKGDPGLISIDFL